MKEIEEYVEKLFAAHKESREIRELKEEIISNLEAKVTDLMEEGLSFSEAFARATKSMDTVDFLVEGSQPIYVDRYKIELAQSVLLYMLVVWILSIPLRFTESGIWFSNMATIAVLLCGGIYVAGLLRKSRDLQTVAVLNVARLEKAKKAAWIIWGLYAAVMTVYTTAIKFGSHFWFGRSVRIDGPYQFALLVADYAPPLLLILVPMMFWQASKLADKCEVKE
ncbi:permease prefix domain 1-containing protein [Brevibacillus borstelensis]|uniref:permease prefix domain 1-containing protein n=1 Tax=Brevibacillus borstelensis TaxID=45462 RepID=UPI0030C51B3B